MITIPAAFPRRAATALSHDGTRYHKALGCDGCKDHEHCGGLNIPGGLLNCYAQCCGNPATCHWVCRKNPDFVRHAQSFRGFDLGNVSVVITEAPPKLPAVVPLLYHGYRRTGRLAVDVAAIKLVQLFERRTGAPRFTSRAELTDHFKLAETTNLIVSGIDDDPVIERWWAIGANARRRVIESMRACGIGIVTCPNFSLCLDWPRTGDLAAIKRIAIAHEEFTAAGLPAALHVNGRTDHDFVRWGAFLAQHQSITHLAYEFTTGAGRQSRRDIHIDWLNSLPARAGRPLNIVVHGDISIARGLRRAFDRVTWIDTTSFIKAVHRRKATRLGNGAMGWQPSLTAPQAPIDDLIAHNITETKAYFSLHDDAI